MRRTRNSLFIYLFQKKKTLSVAMYFSFSLYKFIIKKKLIAHAERFRSFFNIITIQLYELPSFALFPFNQSLSFAGRKCLFTFVRLNGKIFGHILLYSIREKPPKQKSLKTS